MKITRQAIVVYGKRNNKLIYFKIYDYKNQEKEAHKKFNELMQDSSVDEYRMMTIERLSEILKEGCKALY